MSSLLRVSKLQFVREKWSSLKQEIAFPIDLQPKGELENGKRYEGVGTGELMNTPQIRGRGLSICAAAAVAFPHSHHLKLFSVFFLFSFFLLLPIPAALIFFLIFHSPVLPFFIYPSHCPPPPPSSSRYQAEGLFWRCFGGVDRLSSERSRRARAAFFFFFFADRLDKRAEAARPSSQRAACACRRNRKKASAEMPRGCNLEL